MGSVMKCHCHWGKRRSQEERKVGNEWRGSACELQQKTFNNLRWVFSRTPGLVHQSIWMFCRSLLPSDLGGFLKDFPALDFQIFFYNYKVTTNLKWHFCNLLLMKDRNVSIVRSFSSPVIIFWCHQRCLRPFLILIGVHLLLIPLIRFNQDFQTHFLFPKLSLSS